ncbi:MAG: retropepsin-like aspartic protease [Roseibacillus sp.]|nr:retropepsin-like aspartic protease [Roseibacillus sp.]
MKILSSRILVLLFAGLAVAAGLLFAEEEGYRTFTDAKGRTLEAIVVSKTDTAVNLLIKGRENPIEVALKVLSSEDQAFLKNWMPPEVPSAELKKLFLQKCRTLTVRELLELRGYESFKFTFANNSLIIPGLLNGKKARFLVDTGAHNTILHDAFAKEAGCRMGPYDEVVAGVGGTAPAAYTKVDRIQLGETLILGKKLLCTDLTNGLPAGSKPKEDAIIGGELLARLDAVISYRERLIFLRPDLGDKPEVGDLGAKIGEKDTQFDFRIFKLKDGTTIRGKLVAKNESGTGITIELVNGEKRGFTVDRFKPEDELLIRRWSEDAVAFERNCRDLTVKDLLNIRSYQSFETERKGNHIYVEGALNGDKAKFLVDTGADGSLFNIGSANQYRCEVGPMDQWVYGIGGRAPAAVTKFKSIAVGKTLIENRRILSADFSSRDSVGIYGGDFMRELDAVITYREMRLFLRQK